jgi:hypothetical protein
VIVQDGRFIVRDVYGQAFGYFYFETTRTAARSTSG